MVGDFWSELFGSVGSLFNTLLQSRSDREFVFIDQDVPPGASDLGLGGGTPAAQPMWVQAKAQLENLQKADPNFAEPDFLSQASKAYNAVLCAEGAMDASSIAASVTPALFQCFSGKIQHWRQGGFTRVVSDVNLDPPTTFKVSIGGDTQAITVRFTGSAKRFTREDMTNLVTEGSAQAESFTEFATFVRPAGSSTPKTTAEGAPNHCPSCGAPVESGALKCSFCGASLTGTGGTWLLDKLSVSAYT